MKRLIIPVLVLAINSCGTPMKVATNILKEYPSSTPADEIVVLEKGEGMPADADIIGNVYVYDDGTAKKVPLDTTLAIARSATSAHGGNILNILEITPPSAFASSNYQLYGEMAYSESGVEEREETSFTPGEASASGNSSLTVSEEPVVKGSHVYASVGYGRITSDFGLDDSVTLVDGDLRNNFTITAGYEYVFKNGFGFGAAYDDTSLGYVISQVDNGTTLTADVKDNLRSFMATFSICGDVDSFHLGCRAGLGYCAHKNITSVRGYGVQIPHSSTGVALHLSAEALYRFTHSFSAGITISQRNYAFAENESNFMQGSIESYGIAGTFRISF